jgi:hypothetical protein
MFGLVFRKPDHHGPRARGVIRGFSRGSRRRLEFVAANLEARFQTLVTLTYHANVERWEDDAERNRRVVLRSKRDLNRFLSCLRGEFGQYLWVQEFQQRGVVHYHVLVTGVFKSRVSPTPGPPLSVTLRA